MASEDHTIPITRLHISPLTPDLLLTALGPQLLKSACNVSYHSVQTAPDTPFGYVDLPSAEADKVRKKLHGAILKGRKMKVEVARPKKRRHADVDADAGGSGNNNPTDQEPLDPPQTRAREKRKEDSRNTLPGHELSPDRKVKRGWTEKKASSKNRDNKSTTKPTTTVMAAPARPASKFTDKEELLFRTKLPDNKADMATKSKKKKNKKTTPNSQVVHEFERNTVQPTFLKDEGPKGPGGQLHFVDGQGWVDGQGNVIEREPTNLLQRREAKREAKRAKASLQDQEDANPNPDEPPSSDTTPIHQDESQTEPQAEAQTEPTTINVSSSKTASNTPTPQEATVDSESRLHPLEAIFKKPQKPASSQDVAKPSLEVQTSFSFFGDIPDDDLDDQVHEPMTPFTSQDMRFRGLRSAAPTPDTARPSRFNSYSSVAHSTVDEGSQSEPDDDQDMDSGEPEELPGFQAADPGAEAGTGPTQESPFVKAFWEKRGENNRAWKARRKTVLKEKRQRENRSRRPKNW